MVTILPSSATLYGVESVDAASYCLIRHLLPVVETFKAQHLIHLIDICKGTI